MPHYSSYAKHEELKRQIVLNPQIIGLEDIISHQEEVRYTNGRRILGQVDLIFWDRYGKPYIVEVTTSTSEKARRRVRKQVRRAKSYFAADKGITVVKTGNSLLFEWL